MTKRKILYNYVDLIGNIGEIALVLHPLRESPLEMWVLKASIYGQSGISVRIPDAGLLINLATLLGLIEIKKKRKRTMISLTNTGKHILKLKQFERDRFTKQQGKFLLAATIKKIDILTDLILVINMFSTDYEGNMLITPYDTRIGDIEALILRLLQQIGLARYNDGNIVIEKNEMNWLLTMVSSEPYMSLDDLLNLLEVKRRHGELAEDYVLHEERKRLAESGREDLAKLVKKISDRNVRAGYDISSFAGRESDVIPDRFIEVKGTEDNQILFYISKNEIETARKLRDKYWIYCVLNVKMTDSKRLKMIKNPYSTVFQNKKFSVEPVLWRVHALNKSS